MGLVSNLVERIRGHGLGFRMDEVMSGTHRFEPGAGPEGEHPMEFRVTWGPDHLSAWLDPRKEGFLRQPLEGRVTVGGLCSNVPCKGTLALDYFRGNRIVYSFDFTVDDTEYHFVGEKVNIKPWNLPVSHTTCYGVLTEKETGKLVSRSVTHFRLNTALDFVLSFRLARATEG